MTEAWDKWTGDETPYLILHKVRGAPAFDIAIKLQIGDEEGWIIPTSGHRAYPYWYRSLPAIELSKNPTDDHIAALALRLPMPHDWPDHYSCNATPQVIRTTARELLAKLGLGPPQLKRRKLG